MQASIAQGLETQEKFQAWHDVIEELNLGNSPALNVLNSGKFMNQIKLRLGFYLESPAGFTDT